MRRRAGVGRKPACGVIKTAAPILEAGCVFEPLPVRCPAPPRGDGDRDQSLEVSRGSAIGWVSQSAATNSGAVARRS